MDWLIELFCWPSKPIIRILHMLITFCKHVSQVGLVLWVFRFKKSFDNFSIFTWTSVCDLVDHNQLINFCNYWLLSMEKDTSNFSPSICWMQGLWVLTIVIYKWLQGAPTLMPTFFNSIFSSCFRYSLSAAVFQLPPEHTCHIQLNPSLIIASRPYYSK